MWVGCVCNHGCEHVRATPGHAHTSPASPRRRLRGQHRQLTRTHMRASRERPPHPDGVYADRGDMSIQPGHRARCTSPTPRAHGPASSVWCCAQGMPELVVATRVSEGLGAPHTRPPRQRHHGVRPPTPGGLGSPHSRRRSHLPNTCLNDAHIMQLPVRRWLMLALRLLVRRLLRQPTPQPLSHD